MSGDGKDRGKGVRGYVILVFFTSTGTRSWGEPREKDKKKGRRKKKKKKKKEEEKKCKEKRVKTNAFVNALLVVKVPGLAVGSLDGGSLNALDTG